MYPKRPRIPTWSSLPRSNSYFTGTHIPATVVSTPLHGYRAPYHSIHLNVGARADLMWWQIFLADWNGMSFFPVTTPPIHVFSDASGSFGCGAYSSTYGWFQLQWPEAWHSVHIAAKELVPVVIAAAMWGSSWTRCNVCFNSDNMAVVELLKSRTSQDPLLMNMLRCFSFYAAYFKFVYRAEHVPGVLNTTADAISRNNISLFLSFLPQSPRLPIPQAVVDLPVHKRPDWGSHDWTRLFKASLRKE